MHKPVEEILPGVDEEPAIKTSYIGASGNGEKVVTRTLLPRIETMGLPTNKRNTRRWGARTG
jgi:hypothetical protein